MKGDAISLVMRADGTEFQDAVQKCEEITGMQGVALEKQEAKPVRVSGISKARKAMNSSMHTPAPRRKKRKW